MAWWTGRWYGRGLGSHVMSQPLREFVVKIVELSLWSGDLLLGHFLLFMLTPPILIPYFDRFHATILFWLRPSKQIRAPLYSLKQRRQRRWIVSRLSVRALRMSWLTVWQIIKYGIFYVLVIIVFVALVAIRKQLPSSSDFVMLILSSTSRYPPNSPQDQLHSLRQLVDARPNLNLKLLLPPFPRSSLNV